MTAHEMTTSEKLDYLIKNFYLLGELIKAKSGIETQQSKKFFESHFLFICFVSCFYQCFKITSLYLESEMSSEILYFPTDPVIPPAVTICVGVNESINLFTVFINMVTKSYFRYAYLQLQHRDKK